MFCCLLLFDFVAMNIIASSLQLPCFCTWQQWSDLGLFSLSWARKSPVCIFSIMFQVSYVCWFNKDCVHFCCSFLVVFLSISVMLFQSALAGPRCLHVCYHIVRCRRYNLHCAAVLLIWFARLNAMCVLCFTVLLAHWISFSLADSIAFISQLGSAFHEMNWHWNWCVIINKKQNYIVQLVVESM